MQQAFLTKHFESNYIDLLSFTTCNMQTESQTHSTASHFSQPCEQNKLRGFQTVVWELTRVPERVVGSPQQKEEKNILSVITFLEVRTTRAEIALAVLISYVL